MSDLVCKECGHKVKHSIHGECVGSALEHPCDCRVHFEPMLSAVIDEALAYESGDVHTRPDKLFAAVRALREATR